MSENENAQIIGQLIKAQQNIEIVAKNRKNEHFNYSYADLSSIIASSQKILNDLDIYVYQGFDFFPEDNSFYVYTRLIHKSGEEIKTKIGFPLIKSDPQSIGSLCTYGRRYSLCAILGIATEDDDAHSTTSWRTQEQIGSFANLLQHKAFDGVRNETKKWWKNLKTEQESAKALAKMEEKIAEQVNKELDETKETQMESEV